MERLTIAGIPCVLGLCCSAPLMAVNKTEPSVQETTSAARKGDAAAQLKLGEMYDLGEGVTQDYKEAVKWYRLSAEQGNATARFALAEMYKNSDGVPKNIQTAIKWYRLAAEQNYSMAQLLLANLYNVGQGVARDPVAAYALYTVSAEREPRGNPATGHRTELSKGMSVAGIERANVLAREMVKPGNLLKALDQHLKKPT